MYFGYTGVQGQSWLLNGFKACLDYMTLCLQNKRQKKNPSTMLFKSAFFFFFPSWYKWHGLISQQLSHVWLSPLHLRWKHCSYTKKTIKGKTIVSSLFQLSSGQRDLTSASAAMVQYSNCYSCLYQLTGLTEYHVWWIAHCSPSASW